MISCDFSVIFLRFRAGRSKKVSDLRLGMNVINYTSMVPFMRLFEIYDNYILESMR